MFGLLRFWRSRYLRREGNLAVIVAAHASATILPSWIMLGDCGHVLVLGRLGCLRLLRSICVIGRGWSRGVPLSLAAVPIFRSASLSSPFLFSPLSLPHPLSVLTNQITRGFIPADLPPLYSSKSDGMPDHRSDVLWFLFFLFFFFLDASDLARYTLGSKHYRRATASRPSFATGCTTVYVADGVAATLRILLIFCGPAG